MYPIFYFQYLEAFAVMENNKMYRTWQTGTSCALLYNDFHRKFMDKNFVNLYRCEK